MAKTKKAAEKKGKTQPVTFRLAEPLLEELEIHADETRQKIASFVEAVVIEFLAKHPVDDATRKRFQDRCEQSARKMEKMGLPASRAPLRTPRKSHFASVRRPQRAAI